MAESPLVHPAPGRSPFTRLALLLQQRSVQVTIVFYLACVVVAAVIAPPQLPFDRPLVAGQSALMQLLAQQGQLLVAGILIAIALWVTRNRPVPDLAARAPALDIARAEVVGLVGYVMLAQVVGAWIGFRFWGHAISLHMPGAVYGTSAMIHPDFVIAWMLYNFIVYAVLPYAVFRARGYSNADLSLHSANWRLDLLLIVVILICSSSVDIAFNPNFFSLSPRQMLLGGLLSLGIHMLGTSLPIMVVIYSILMPRYLKLSNSVATTVILGGISYAVVHIFEGWALYDSLPNATLSLIYVFFQYFGPGMVKAVLTLRSGNAWVHLWAYHSFDPHVWLDTPHIVESFEIQ